MGDAIGCAAGGLLFAGFFLATLGMEGSLRYPLSYAQALIAGTAILFFAAAALSQRGAGRGALAATAPPAAPGAAQGAAGGGWVVAGTITLCIAYAALWQPIGYFPRTFLYVAVQLWLLRERRPAFLLGVPAAATLLVYLVFYRLLQLPFPMGDLFAPT